MREERMLKGQSRDTGNIGQKAQNEDKQYKQHTT